MRNIVISVLMLAGFAAHSHADWELTSASPEGMTITWSDDNADWDTVLIDGQTALIPRGAALSVGAGVPGEVGVVSASAPLALPHDLAWSWSILPGVTQSGDGQVAPVPQITEGSDGMGPSRVLKFANPAYALPGPIPATWVRVDEKGEVGGTRLASITVFPVRAFPSSKTWQRLKSITVSIKFSGRARTISRASAHTNPVAMFVLNSEWAEKWRRVVPAARLAQSSSPFASGLWLRVVLGNTGMYRLTHAQAAEAAPGITGTLIGELGLFRGSGRPLPISPEAARPDSLAPVSIRVVDTNSDNLFNGGDFVEFYAQGVNHWVSDVGSFTFRWIQNPYTSESVYWLTNSTTSPPRTGFASGLPDPSAGVITVLPSMSHNEDDLENFAEYDDTFRDETTTSGREWIWTILKAQTSTLINEQKLLLRPPGWIGPDLRVKVRYLFNVNTNVSLSLPRLGMRIGGLLADTTWTILNGPHGAVISGTATLNQPDGSQIALDIINSSYREVSLDYYELWHNRSSKPIGGRLEWYLPALRHTLPDEPLTVELTEVAADNYRLFDVTVPNRSEEISLADATPAGGGTNLRVGIKQSGLVPRRFLLVDNDTWQTPKRIELKNFSNIREHSGSVDFIIVTHSDFMDQAVQLAEWREAHSTLATKVVDIQDVYDEFSWGFFDPTAIRDLCVFASTRWTSISNDDGPDWLLLFGDGQYDYQNITRSTGNSDDPHPGNWIPPYEDGDTTTDDWFAALTSSQIPEMRVGRIPSRTAEEAQAFVDKLIEYETVPIRGAWQHKMIFLCDDEYNSDFNSVSEQFFTEDCEYLSEQGFIRDDILREKIYSIDYSLDDQRSKPGARAALIRAWNEGALLLNYVGHGNPRQFAHERLFVLNQDIDKLTNRYRQPILTALTCSAGHFDDPVREAMVEDLLFLREGGIIAGIAASRLSYNGPNVAFNNQFFFHLFSGSRVVRLGDAFFGAKLWAYVEINSWFTRQNSRKFILIGDPTMVIALPELPVRVSVVGDSITALSEAVVEGAVTTELGDTLRSFNGKALVQLYDTSRKTTYLSAGNVNVSYIAQGNTIFRGIFPIINGLFRASAIVPGDITLGASDAKIIVLVWNDDYDGSGSLTGIKIARTPAEGEPDTEGPEIAFYRPDGSGDAGTLLFDGDPIYPPDPLRIVLRDPSGINMTGEIGRAITLTFDKGSRGTVDLTQQFLYQGSATEGWADAYLDDIPPGQHRITVQAWDTRGNVTQDSITISIGKAGAPTIIDVIAHPNPMSPSSGAFTYTLLGMPEGTAAEVNISVYSISGRLVERLPVQIQSKGPHIVHWTPRQELANGVYLYRITASDPDTGAKASVTERLAVVAK